MAYLGNTATQQAFTPAIDYFSGNGSTVAFTLSRPVASVAQVQVNVNNVAQNPSTAFTVLNNTITFTGAPSSGTNNIYVQYTSPITQVIQPGQGTVGTTQIADASITPAKMSGGAPSWSALGGVSLPRIDSTTEGGQLNLNRSTDDTSAWSVDVYGSTSTPSLRFVDNIAGATRMAIDGSGNLLVGTTSNGINARLNVLAQSAANPAAIGAQVGTNGAYAFGVQNASGTNVGGVIANASTTSYATSSDYRLKENIAPMTGALDVVAKLKPCTYSWKFTGEFTQGFIAHELQAVVPECVTGEKDAVDKDGNPKYQGVDTSFLVATLTAAIQELKAIVDTQAAKIAALEAK
jgi:hypothetical protein